MSIYVCTYGCTDIFPHLWPQVCKRIEKIIDVAHLQSMHGNGNGPHKEGRNRSMSYVPISQDDRPRPPPEYIVLDCSFVSGLDGNAVDGLLKLQVCCCVSCPFKICRLMMVSATRVSASCRTQICFRTPYTSPSQGCSSLCR